MRIHFIIIYASVCFPFSLPVRGAEREQVDLDYVSKLALERAKEPFHSPKARMPDVLRQDKLDYDKYRKIQFRHDRAFWLGDKLPFRAEFFHPGYIYQEPVQIYEFNKSFVQHVRFVEDWFNYADTGLQNQVPADTGYAGFKILYPVNKAGAFDEVASFLGASYFRMLGKDQRYGASARGLALDCGETDRPEEFPIFTDFWLGKPQPGDRVLHLFALLDSVSCTGAYEFHLRPGETTICQVDAVLFFRAPDKLGAANKYRKPLVTVGMAPLTSMFWFGANSERKFDDYRPQVHDSDGLLMQMDTGEVIWRPLNNASVMRHSVFATKNIRGFGLMQRDRDFSHYEDMFNLYHKVPGVWVKPAGDWGDGEVHLVELSSNSEGLDNVAAFWNPKQKPAPMQPFRFSYELLWMLDEDNQISENYAAFTRVGLDGADPKKRQAHIEFTGPKLAALADNDPPQAVTSCTPNAKIYGTQVLRDPFDGNWRVVIKFQPQDGNTQPVDLRCTLKKGDETVSETWAYLWSPP